jgi:hypothetical protein
MIAGEIVFSGVYPWLADSGVESRRAWRDSLQPIAALHPGVVIAGHKKNANFPDSPGVVAAMEKYHHAESPHRLSAPYRFEFRTAGRPPFLLRIGCDG